jgi:hypothetical protein
MTVRKIVQNHRLVMSSQQLPDAMAANVPGSAGDENLHIPDLYCFWISDG